MSAKEHTGACPYCHSTAMGQTPVALPTLALLKSTVMEIERALDLLDGSANRLDILEKRKMRA